MCENGECVFMCVKREREETAKTNLIFGKFSTSELSEEKRKKMAKTLTWSVEIIFPFSPSERQMNERKKWLDRSRG